MTPDKLCAVSVTPLSPHPFPPPPPSWIDVLLHNSLRIQSSMPSPEPSEGKGGGNIAKTTEANFI